MKLPGVGCLKSKVKIDKPEETPEIEEKTSKVVAAVKDDQAYQDVTEDAKKPVPPRMQDVTEVTEDAKKPVPPPLSQAQKQIALTIAQFFARGAATGT